jgi:uncharacterized protein (UPF0332 family)
MSHLQRKSEVLSAAAELLHEKEMYPAVAHSAYYSCYQLSRHIWKHKMGKTWADLNAICRSIQKSSHDALINEVRNYILNSNRANCATHVENYYRCMMRLKRLRVNGDYDDEIFDKSKSESAINLSNKIISVIRKYQ